MKNDDLRSMSVDELWRLHALMVVELGRRIAAERDKLENRLRQLGALAGDSVVAPAKRPYPKVLPKYRNPENHSETWAGRGKRPRWLEAQLRSGKKLSDFLIRKAHS